MPHVDVDGVPVYYEFVADGPGRPTLLEFGGSVLARSHFDTVNDRLGEHFRLLTYDPRGYGRSGRPQEPYSVEMWADEAAGLLDALGLDRVLVIGSSGGGMNALAFAGRHPERCVGLVADCCYARPDATRRNYFRVWRHMLETAPRDDLSDLITTQVLSPAFLESHPEWIDGGRRGMLRVAPSTLAQSFIAQETMDLEASVRRISAPTLMTSFAHDMLCPARLEDSGFGALDMQRALPELVTVRVLDGYGHAPLVEAPEIVVPEMIDHLLAAHHRTASPVGLAR